MADSRARGGDRQQPSGVGSERLLSLDERPRLWLDERAQSGGWDYIAGAPLPMREYGSDIPAAGQSPLLPDNAHQPSIAFVPYLLTGDRYYAEEMAFWANYGMVRTYPGDGMRSSQGILANNEVRGFGWALRNLADAAAYYPDASPVKAYLSQKVINNLQWLDAYARAQDPVANPFQILWVNTPARWRSVHRVVGADLPGPRDRSRQPARLRRGTGAPRRDRAIPAQAVHERAGLPARATRAPI